jgi:hypothetical protein
MIVEPFERSSAMLKTKAGEIIGTPGPDAYTLSAFCKAHGISVSTLYNLMHRGTAPRLMRVGKRVLVSREAAADWRRQMERGGVTQ